MKLRLIPAVLLGAVFAVAAHASAPASSSDIPPTVIAQLEIRGLAPLFGQTARIMAPFIPPQEADNAIKRFLRNICPVDLVSLVGADSADPIRAVVYSKPGAVSPGIMFDLPAANGDIDAFFAVVARSCATAAVPPAVAARLPSGARLYRLPSAAVATGSDPRVLFLPHGSRVAVWPLSMRGGVQPIQAARLVSAFPPIAAEGVISSPPPSPPQSLAPATPLRQRTATGRSRIQATPRRSRAIPARRPSLRSRPRLNALKSLDIFP